MKKFLISILLIISMLTIGCSTNNNFEDSILSENQEEKKDGIEEVIDNEEQKKIKVKINEYSLENAIEGINEGNLAKNIICPSNKNETFDLSKNKGKVVLVNMWATWCPPCVKEMPAFQKMYNELDKEKFTMIAISNENRKVIDDFIEENKYDFPIGYDENNSQIMMTYEVMSIPLTLIINQEGIIQKKFLGAVSAEKQYEEYMNVIKQLLD